MLAFTRSLSLRTSSSIKISPPFAPSRNYVRYGGVEPSQAATIKLNTLAPAPGATHKLQRVGRGIGSGRGKTSTRGHKGQSARTHVPVGFEGGQTPLFRRMRKFGFKNRFTRKYTPLNLDTLSKFLEAKRLDPSRPITMRSLKDAGVLKQIKTGVKLVARGAEKWNISTPLHIEVSQASKKARAVIEANGGSVKTIYFNKLGLRTFLRKDPSEITIKFAAAPRKLETRFDVLRYELPESVKKVQSPSDPTPLSPAKKIALKVTTTAKAEETKAAP